MLRNQIESVEDKKKRKAAIKRNQQISLAVSFFESMDLAAIYTMFLKDVLRKCLEKTGKNFMFPLAAGASVIQAILAWRQAALDGKTRSIVRAVVETISAAAITVAVVGSLAASTLFAAATPLVFT